MGEDAQEDEELQEFLEDSPLAKRSDRRIASGRYPNDQEGRFAYNAELVGNGAMARSRVE